MRSSTLITLLPILAVTAINAHPHHRHHDDESISTTHHHHHHHHTGAQKRQSRKSIAFGPSHVNAEYQVVDPAVTTTTITTTTLKETEEDLSPTETKKEWSNKVHQVLKARKGFKGEEGVDWVIREDVSVVVSCLATWNPRSIKSLG
jgi:hypothetical protein